MTTLEARLVRPGQLPRIQQDQLQKLEQSFRDCRNPNSSDLILLAAEVGLTEQETRVWFQHRLALWRKQQGLPANQHHIVD